jgi:hypothetical protein
MNLSHKYIQLVNEAMKNDQLKCWLNSSPTSTWQCRCNSWYSWKNPNDSKNFDCVKDVEIDNDKICKSMYWPYSYWEKNKNYCSCVSGYIMNPSITSCIKEKTPTELCQIDFWVNSYSDWSKSSNWWYNCYCKTWYVWSSNQTSCIKEVKKEEPKKEEVKINLPDNTKKQIDKAFDNVKNK